MPLMHALPFMQSKQCQLFLPANSPPVLLGLTCVCTKPPRSISLGICLYVVLLSGAFCNSGPVTGEVFRAANEKLGLQRLTNESHGTLVSAFSQGTWRQSNEENLSEECKLDGAKLGSFGTGFEAISFYVTSVKQFFMNKTILPNDIHNRMLGI